MSKEKMNKLVSKMMIMAVLTTGLLFVGTQSTAAQEVCKTVDQLKTESPGEAEIYEQRDCWVSKAKNGEKNLSGALLTSGDLNGADLRGADLTGANLTLTSLIEADLREANLTGADLRGADLRDANLQEANLTEAIVSEQYTKGVDFDMWKSRGGTIVE